MKTICQFLIVVFLLYFCEQMDSAFAQIKRSIATGQDAGMFFVTGFQPFCDRYKDLTPRQRDICRDDMLLMGSVVEGASLAAKECQEQFKNEKWNCSSFSHKSAALGLMTKSLTKEAAFNYAIVAAGIVDVMARNCMKGDLPSCSCSREQRPQSLEKKYKWGGCGDNIEYASQFSKTFLNDPKVFKLNGSSDTKRAQKLLMDVHNMEAGRQAIYHNRKRICKCHGATSHCTTKTCWHQVNEFKFIGDYLKQKYDLAKKVKVSKRNNKKKLALKADRKGYTKHDLVYIEHSPSYCQKQAGYHSQGTVGRQCDANTVGPGSCRYLCCGRSHKTERRTIVKNCRCKFHWCCDVRCETCNEVVDVHTCL